MTGAELRRLREGLGLTVPELAERIGVHWTTVYRWERGQVAISEPVAQLVRLLVKLKLKSTPKGGR